MSSRFQGKISFDSTVLDDCRSSKTQYDEGNFINNSWHEEVPWTTDMFKYYLLLQNP